jgi:hypothetical protein|tara:strand:+ start:12020 stop:12292 length:273 start_codon:yes stop_codon:yes gene_type:complete
MAKMNVITIEKNIPIPAVINGRGCEEKYNFIKDMEIDDSFKINGVTPDFSPVGVRAHVYGLNSSTERTYTIRTIEGHSSNPIAIRVWRTK